MLNEHIHLDRTDTLSLSRSETSCKYIYSALLPVPKLFPLSITSALAKTRLSEGATTFKFLNVLEQFKVNSKIERKVARFPIHPLPHTCTTTFIVSVFYQSGTSVTTDEPTFTRHYHPKFIVRKVHSW